MPSESSQTFHEATSNLLQAALLYARKNWQVFFQAGFIVVEEAKAEARDKARADESRWQSLLERERGVIHAMVDRAFAKL